MSRRTFSFSTSKPNLSPFKDHSKSSKDSKSSVIHLPLASPSSQTNSFISVLQSKLKEKYTNLSFALKKISDSYPTEIPVSHFKLLLKDLKFKYAEKEFQEFFKLYGKSHSTQTQSTIPLESLAKCLIPNLLKSHSPKPKKKISLIKTQSLSTQSSIKNLEENLSSLNLTIPDQKAEDCPCLKSQEKDFFILQLLENFQNPEEATEYFFLNRGICLTFEEFSESVQSLKLQYSHDDLSRIFCGFKSSTVTKTDFFEELFNTACKQLDETWQLLNEFRSRLHKYFTTYVKAFQEISGNKPCITLPILEEVSHKLGMKLDRAQLTEMFSKYQPDCQLHFQAFKCFWTGKEGICSIKSCESSVLATFSYCPGHFQSLTNRGEEIFSKLQIILKPQQFSTLAQNILKESQQKGFLVNGFELQKKDVRALKEFLKFHNFPTQRLTKSVKTRVS